MAHSINSTVCVLFIGSLVLCVHDVDERITNDQDDPNYDDYDDLYDADHSNATVLQNGFCRNEHCRVSVGQRVWSRSKLNVYKSVFC